MVWGGSPASYEEMESGATTLKRLACMEGGSMDLRGSQPQGVGTERALCDTELEAGSLEETPGLGGRLETGGNRCARPALTTKRGT